MFVATPSSSSTRLDAPNSSSLGPSRALQSPCGGVGLLPGNVQFIPRPPSCCATTPLCYKVYSLSLEIQGASNKNLLYLLHLRNRLRLPFLVAKLCALMHVHPRACIPASCVDLSIRLTKYYKLANRFSVESSFRHITGSRPAP